jgi:hypothetical protein
VSTAASVRQRTDRSVFICIARKIPLAVAIISSNPANDLFAAEQAPTV